MLIQYHGHSEFLLETADGRRVLTDPYNASVGFPMKKTRADLVTVSHGHGDHAEVSKAEGRPVILRDAGRHEPLPGIAVTGHLSWHDDAGGSKRGRNLCFVIEAEGLRVAHLGDLGSPPDAPLMEALRGMDVLLVPVGGFYTIDALQAAALVRETKPRVVIPMHYRAPEGGLAAIAGPEEFLRLMPGPSRQPLLRVTKNDLSEQPACVLLDIRP